MRIVPATKVSLKATIAVWGPPKAGKSYLALQLAHALCGGIGQGKVGVISSEFKNTALLALPAGNRPGFPHDIIGLNTDDEEDPIPEPFTVEHYLEALAMFEQGRYDAVVIDSGTHLWEGKGGFLDLLSKVNANKKTDKDFSGWSVVSPIYWDFITSLRQSPCHIITTLRCKDAWEFQENPTNHRKDWVNIGQEPIMRNTFPNEMHTIFRVRHDHSVRIDGSYCDELLAEYPDREIKPDEVERAAEILRASLVGEPRAGMTPMELVLRPYKLAHLAQCQAFPNWRLEIIGSALGVVKAERLKLSRKWGAYTEEQIALVDAWVKERLEAKKAAPPAPMEAA